MSKLLFKNVLIVNSSHRKEGSKSRQLVQKVLEHYEKKTKINVKFRDVGLYNISHLNEEWITANLTPVSEQTDEQVQLLDFSTQLINELKEADIIIFGCPMYNFSISSSLKCYFDLCCRSGYTFKYGEKGPEGLLVGKKAVICTTSGGIPSGSSFDFTSKYMKHICNFIGIEDCTIIEANCLLSGDENQIMKKAELEIENL